MSFSADGILASQLFSDNEMPKVHKLHCKYSSHISKHTFVKNSAYTEEVFTGFIL